MGEFVNLEATERDGVAVIRINRPKVNAISGQLSLELLDVANELTTRHDIRAVVMWGGPRFFAAGADIGEFPSDGPPEERDPTGMTNPLNDALLTIEGLDQITISAVNGFALGGGCELSMSTDFRVCGEGAIFGQPEILLGIIPGAGGTQRLTRLVGVTKSKELNYTGRQVKADEALEIGLVSAVYPDDEVFDHALDMAEMYAKGPAALKNVKRSIMGGLNVDIPEAIEVEKQQFKESFKTDDAVIGIKSFLEQGPGKAEFTHR
ncbi:MAG: enoyl-CoA hydratase/isomerase family protein [Acidimicrobiales bacterium]